MKEEANKPNRLNWLDALKGVAILWVVAFHMYVRDLIASGSDGQVSGFSLGSPSLGAELSPFIDSFVNRVLSLGYQGVHLFLVASGFALTYVLAKQDDGANWLAWLKRRFARIIPLYWLAHLFFWTICLITQNWSRMPLGWPALASLFLVNWLGPRWQWYFYGPDAWWFMRTLAQFYMIFPVLFMLLRRLGNVRFLVLAGLVTIGCRSILLFAWGTEYASWLVQGFAGSRLFEFAFGMVCGLAFRQERWWTALHWPVSLGFGVCWITGTCLSVPVWGRIVSDALIGVGGFGFLSAVTMRGVPESYPRKVLEWIGQHSYGLYLIHGPLIAPIRSMLRTATFGLPVVGWLATMAVVTVLGCVFDITGSAVVSHLGKILKRSPATCYGR
jgi:peptidoglycan/LPS O-acetylase OafA/YrhL